MHLAFVITTFLVLVGLVIYAIVCVYEQEQKLSKVEEQCKMDDLTQIDEPSSTSIIILAAARNAMGGLPSFLSNVTRIKKCYPNTRIVFIENDSIDDTRKFLETAFPLILETQVVDPNFTIDKSAKPTGIGKRRVEKMAALRNQLLSHVKDTDDYVMMCDPDWNICIPILKFSTAIEYLKSNDQVVGIVPMLRNRLFYFPFTTSYFDTFAFQNEEFHDPTSNMKEKIGLKFKQWPEDIPVPVDSAFGSFAIYRQKDIRDVTYSVIESDVKGVVRCEHVGFHQALRDKTKKRLELLPWFKIIA